MRVERPVVQGSLWHVTVIHTGTPVSLDELSRGLRRLCDFDPSNMGARYSADRAEVQFWDEGTDVEPVAVAAARLWKSRKAVAGLPDWSLVLLEVMDTPRLRERRTSSPSLIRPGSVAQIA